MKKRFLTIFLEGEIEVLQRGIQIVEAFLTLQLSSLDPEIREYALDVKDENSILAGEIRKAQLLSISTEFESVDIEEVFVELLQIRGDLEEIYEDSVVVN